MMKWYEDPYELAEAVAFVLKYKVCFGWRAILSKKTRCCNYVEIDKETEELQSALRDYLHVLTKEEYRELNSKISLTLGECFFVRKEAIIKALSRIMADGDPRDNLDMIKLSLQMQIRQRTELLESLKIS